MSITPKDFTALVGRQKIAAAVNVVPSAVTNAIDRGVFPASWFIACSELADEAGVICPPYLFGMRGYQQVDKSAPSLGQPIDGFK